MRSRFLIVNVSIVSFASFAFPGAAILAADAVPFGHDKVWRIQLTLTAAEFAAMQPAQGGGFGFPGGPAPPKVEPKLGEPKRDTHRGAFGTEYPWVVASFKTDGQAIERIGLRYKGNSTYMATSRNLKRSLKLDLDRHDDAGRFQGQKSLTLNSEVFDPSMGREALAYSIYRAAGVPAPRTAFAEVALTIPGKYDQEHVGAYVAVESVDRNYLKRHFKNSAGLLMKPERIRGLDFLGDDWVRNKDTYQPKREATKDEIQRVIAFTRLVNVAPETQFQKEIAGYLDVDAFLRFMAVTSIIANLDSFFVLGHNYYLYLHPETKKFHFIPWDLDLAFANFPWIGTPAQQMDLALTKPYGGSCKLADRLMANKEIAERYQAILKEVVPLCFNKEKLLAEIAILEKSVKPLIEKEAKTVAARKENAGAFGPPGMMFGRATPDLKAFVEKRTESIAAQLAGRSKGYTPASFGAPAGNPRPLPGDVLSPIVQNTLQLTEQQKKELADLQKKVDVELEKILTPEQRSQLKRIREGGGMGGPPPRP